MKIALGADHKGVSLKRDVSELVKSMGHEVIDFGTNSEESVDYSEFGLKVAHAVASGKADRGITICWTGNGMNIAANKVRGIRAGLALNRDMAFYTRLHNDANVMSLSAKYSKADEIRQIVEAFLNTEFEGGRHSARLDRIRAEEAAADIPT